MIIYFNICYNNSRKDHKKNEKNLELEIFFDIIHMILIMEVKRKLNGKLYKLKLITKNIDELMFNPFNTRIYDLIKSNKDLENFEVSSDNSSLHNIQNVIYDRLKRNFGISENSEIVDSIKADGVQEKMIIMPNGILLSGNNRLSIIKNLIERNQ